MVAVVPVVVAVVVAKAVAEVRPRALTKLKGAYFCLSHYFSCTNDLCSKATVSSGDEAEEGEEEEQVTGDENEEGDGESLGGDEEDKRDETLDFME